MCTPNEKRKKLDVKIQKCIILGYASGVKGYKVYDPAKCSVTINRDVIFHESMGIPNKVGDNEHPTIDLNYDLVQPLYQEIDQSSDEEEGIQPVKKNKELMVHAKKKLQNLHCNFQGQ
eukprot:Gb_35569 [translate_table: standard]